MFIKKLKILSPVFIIVIAIVMAVLLSGKKSLDIEKEKKVIIQLPVVKVMAAKYQNKIVTISSQGIVKPSQETQLIAEVSGIINFISSKFKVGSFFHKGDILLSVDSIDYEVEVKKAQAVVAQKKALLAQETALASQARKQWTKSMNPTSLALREPFLAEAKALVTSAEADLQRAQIKFERTAYRAPYDGIVLSEDIGLGQYLNVGTSIGDIFSVATAEVRLPFTDNKLALLDVPELSDLSERLSQIKNINSAQGETCLIKVVLTNNYKNKKNKWNAKICRSEAVINSENRAHYLIATIDDPYNLYGDKKIAQQQQKKSKLVPLKNGSFVEAEIQSKTLTNVIAVPRYLLRENNQLVIIENNNTISFRQVSIVYKDDTFIYVNSGIKEGEKICITSIDFPIVGSKVVVQKESRS